MSKFCKNCKKLNPYPLNKFCSPECKKELGIEYFTKPRKVLKRTELKRSTKPVKAISEKRKTRLASWDREDLLFDKVREYKKNCWICDQDELWDESFTFPHILAKGMRKALRLLPQNIGRACSIEHHDILDILIAYNNKNWIQTKIELEKLILLGKEVVINKDNLYRFYKKA